MEWVEIIEPRTKDHMYANLTTGECVWDPPKGVNIKRADSSQWWELFDTNTQRFYYYNVSSLSTVWHRPSNCDIIPLAKLQTLKQNTDPSEQRSSADDGGGIDRSTGGSSSNNTATRSKQRAYDFGQSHLRHHSGSSGGDVGTSGRSSRQPADNGSTAAPEMRGGDLKMSPHARHSYRIPSAQAKANPVSRTESQRFNCRHGQGSTSSRNKSHLDSGKSSDSSLSSSHGYRRLQDGGGSLRIGPSSHSSVKPTDNYRMLQESSSSHNIPHVALPGSSSATDSGKGSSNYPPMLSYSISNSSDLCCAATSGTPQLKKKLPADHFAHLAGGGGVVVVKRHDDSSAGTSGNIATKHQSFDYSSSNNKDSTAALSLPRSGSFLSSPRSQHYQPPAMSSVVPRKPVALEGGNGGANSDDSMHEKYFKSVESTPLSRRRNVNSGTPVNPPGSSSHNHSSDSSPHSPISPQNNSIKATRPSVLSSLALNDGSTSSAHKLDADLVNLHLTNKPEKYLDKMKMAQTKISPSGSTGSGSAAISMQQINNLLKAGNQKALAGQQKTGYQPGSVFGSSREVIEEEPYLSKPNLERHSKELEHVLSAKKMHHKTGTGSRKNNQYLGTGVSEVEYADNGNISPLYSNWDQEMQEHLLPLQHYIIEQAKLSGCYRLGGETMDSDSLHSDSQSEHSFSGHEPDNEDSDHSDGHEGDYLTHHYGGMGDYDGDADDDDEGVSYYNYVKHDKKDISELVESKLESVGGKVYSPIHNHPYFQASTGVPTLSSKDSPMRQSPAPAPPQPKLPPSSLPANIYNFQNQHHPQHQTLRHHQQQQQHKQLQLQNQKSFKSPGAAIEPHPPIPPFSQHSRLPDIGSLAPPPPPSVGHPPHSAQHHQLAIMKECDIEKFAQDNLNLHSKGIFRKKSSVRDMLSWTADAISRPMLALSRDKAGKKMAIELFKLVQIYMGDRKARAGMSLNSVIRDIALAAVTQPPLRDELYVQLCRQTTENHSRESLIRGWELMAICLSFIPPSLTFQPALLNYMNRHRDPTFATSFPEVGKWPIHVQVSHYATIACRRLDRIGSGGKKQAKKPNEDEINQARDQIFHISMFGNTLDEVMELQKDRHPNRRLPWVQVTLSEQVLLLNGKQTEGIFRVSADVDEVNSLKSRLDRWDVPEHKSTMDAHAPASLLKLWYRELYDPLIPDDLYDDCVATDNPAEVAAIINKLKPLNKSVLTYLVHFLQQFALPDIVANTKMDSSNLAMVFAPNCLRCTSQDPKVILENARKEMAFMRTLITNMDTSNVAGMV